VATRPVPDAPRFAPIVSLDGDDPGRTTPFAMEVNVRGGTHVRLACAIGALLANHDNRPAPDRMAVMVSLSFEELERLDVDSLASALHADGVDADRLLVRVPRYTAGAPSPLLERIAATGVSIVVASLVVPPDAGSRLAGAPVDMIELPTALVEDVDRSPASAERLQPWLDLAHRLDWLSLARNVRRPAQARALHRLGCDLAAGPLMGAPVDPAVDPAFGPPRERRSSRLAG
jgi:EAL domain-containing protein (putative c-di-GMP-specific phosphodiesterase class I)